MKRFLKGFGIFITLVGVGILSAFAVVALLLRQEEVRVPNLVGQDIVAVIDTLGQQGLQLKMERREPSPTVPRDMVISQTPAAGNGIKKGRAVRVVVSTGPSETQAPKIMGEPYRKAEITVRQAGFFPGDIARASSETVERDMVIGQDPPPGTSLEKGGKINMLVSAGKKATAYAMPKLIGKKAEEAVRTIERMGLQHRIVYRAATAEKPAGIERLVVAQKPAPGHPVAADASVELVVSK